MTISTPATGPLLNPFPRRATWAWVLYDWANSAFATTVMAGFFPIFFKQFYSAGTDVTVSTAKLGVANSVATLLVAATGPVFGAIADSSSRKKQFLLFFAFMGLLSTGCLSLVGRGQWEWACLFFIFGSLGYAGSIGFYDSLLPTVAAPGRLDYVSAMGYAWGYLGGGLLFAVNVAMYQFPQAFGLTDGAAAIRWSFLSVALWWGIFSIPLALWVHEPPRAPLPFQIQLRQGLAEFVHTLQDLQHLKQLLLFLSAFLLYNDGVGTAIKMAIDYGISIGFQASDLIKALLLVQFIGFPAAWAFGKISSRLSPKTSILGCLAVYFFVVAWAYQMEKPWEFYFLAAAIGLVQGGVQALSRSYFARLIPLKKAGEYYGFYNLLGKFAGLFGPLLMGITGYLTGSSRAGILSINLLFLLGGLLLLRVNEVQAKGQLDRLP